MVQLAANQHELSVLRSLGQGGRRHMLCQNCSGHLRKFLKLYLLHFCKFSCVIVHEDDLDCILEGGAEFDK